MALFRELQSKTCVVCLSRLETRTKESNMYASHWDEKTHRQNESEDPFTRIEERSWQYLEFRKV